MNIQELYAQAKAGTLNIELKNNKVLTLHSIAINEAINKNQQHYTGEQLIESKLSKIKIFCEENVLNYIGTKYNKETEGASYDIRFNNFRISRYGEFTVNATHIKEVGISSRKALEKRLDKFISEKGFNFKKRELPPLVRSVLAITSKQSAIEDDIRMRIGLKNENIQIQRCQTSEEMSKLIRENDRYDVVVLFRGGNEDSEMNIFSHESIIESIAESSVPVCTALGHAKDNPYISKIADIEYTSPTDFANKIKEHNVMMRKKIFGQHEEFKKRAKYKKLNLEKNAAIQKAKKQKIIIISISIVIITLLIFI